MPVERDEAYGMGEKEALEDPKEPNSWPTAIRWHEESDVNLVDSVEEHAAVQSGKAFGDHRADVVAESPITFPVNENELVHEVEYDALADPSDFSFERDTAPIRKPKSTNTETPHSTISVPTGVARLPEIDEIGAQDDLHNAEATEAASSLLDCATSELTTPDNKASDFKAAMASSGTDSDDSEGLGLKVSTPDDSAVEHRQEKITAAEEPLLFSEAQGQDVELMSDCTSRPLQGILVPTQKCCKCGRSVSVEWALNKESQSICYSCNLPHNTHAIKPTEPTMKARSASIVKSVAVAPASTRTRRQVRNPYEIKNDDDDKHIDPTPVKIESQTQDESLIAFLQNTSAPLSIAASPTFDPMPGAKGSLHLKRVPSNMGGKEAIRQAESLADTEHASPRPANDAGQTLQAALSGTNTTSEIINSSSQRPTSVAGKVIPGDAKLSETRANKLPASRNNTSHHEKPDVVRIDINRSTPDPISTKIEPPQRIEEANSVETLAGKLESKKSKASKTPSEVFFPREPRAEIQKRLDNSVVLSRGSLQVQDPFIWDAEPVEFSSKTLVTFTWMLVCASGLDYLLSLMQQKGLIAPAWRYGAQTFVDLVLFLYLFYIVRDGKAPEIEASYQKLLRKLSKRAEPRSDMMKLQVQMRKGGSEIMLFTAVTVYSLLLSLVASFYGMKLRGYYATRHESLAWCLELVSTGILSVALLVLSLLHLRSKRLEKTNATSALVPTSHEFRSDWQFLKDLLWPGQVSPRTKQSESKWIIAQRSMSSLPRVVGFESITAGPDLKHSSLKDVDKATPRSERSLEKAGWYARETVLSGGEGSRCSLEGITKSDERSPHRADAAAAESPVREGARVPSSGVEAPPLSWYQTMVCGLLEPKLAEGKIRIRYSCACGKSIFDDYPEALAGQATKLETDLRNFFRKAQRQQQQQQTKAGGTISKISRIASDLMYMSNSLRRMLSLKAAESKVDSEGLPVQNPPAYPANEPHYLTCCPSPGDRRPRLFQTLATSIAGDKDYFAALRRQSRSTQRSWARFLVPRKIKTIQYVQLYLLHDNQHVDVVESLKPRFPRDKDEYSPVVSQLQSEERLFLGPNTLMHFFEKEHDCCQYPHALHSIPKKLRGKLHVLNESLPMIGWGMRLVDGIDTFRLGVSGFAGLVASSLVGVTWARTHGDVQGGSGIAQCLMYFVTYVVTMHGVSEVK